MRFRSHLALLVGAVGTWAPTMASALMQAQVGDGTGVGAPSSLAPSERAHDPPGLSDDRRELVSDAAPGDKRGGDGLDADTAIAVVSTFAWQGEPPYWAKWEFVRAPSNDTVYIWLGNDNATRLAEPLWLGAVPSSITRYSVSYRPAELKFETDGWYIQLTGDRNGSYALGRSKAFYFDNPPDPVEEWRKKVDKDMTTTLAIYFGTLGGVMVFALGCAGWCSACEEKERRERRRARAQEQDDNDDEQDGVQLNPLRRDGYDPLDTEDSNV